MQIDPQTAPQQSIYKLLIGCVVPRPIAWVSSLSEDGIPNLAPFSFFMAVCNDPPTVAFSSGRRAGNKKDTVRNIEYTQDFVVNLVDDALAEQMRVHYRPALPAASSAGHAMKNPLGVRNCSQPERVLPV